MGFLTTSWVLEKYDEIMNIILPTLKKREEKLIVLFTYLSGPGRVLEIPLLSMDKKTGKVVFDNKNEKIETNILNSDANYNGKLTGQCVGLLLMLILKCMAKI